jgi:hypothetical protein
MAANFWIVSGERMKSTAAGVCQQAILVTISRVTVALDPSGLRPLAVVPGGALCPPLGVVGVGHEPKSLSSVRASEARSRYINRPEGIT